MTTVTLKRANFQVPHDSREFLLAACRANIARLKYSRDER